MGFFRFGCMYSLELKQLLSMFTRLLFFKWHFIATPTLNSLIRRIVKLYDPNLYNDSNTINKFPININNTIFDIKIKNIFGINPILYHISVIFKKNWI